MRRAVLALVWLPYVVPTLVLHKLAEHWHAEALATFPQHVIEIYYPIEEKAS